MPPQCPIENCRAASDADNSSEHNQRCERNSADFLAINTRADQAVRLRSLCTPFLCAPRPMQTPHARRCIAELNGDTMRHAIGRNSLVTL